VCPAVGHLHSSRCRCSPPGPTKSACRWKSLAANEKKIVKKGLKTIENIFRADYFWRLKVNLDFYWFILPIYTYFNLLC
jgi:hypothetical protein